MKQLRRIAVSSAIILTSAAHSNTNEETSTLIKKVHSNLTVYSAKLGLTPEQFKFAVDQFMRLQNGSTEVKLISEIPEFTNPENYSEAELTQAMNNQKLAIANYLSIPVTSVDTFIKEIASPLGDEFVDYVNTKNLTKKTD
ncbi:hypothetical protein PALB_22660 [Pseudoalteromonas luteoviolacea B = ATCC 29581]|nr:hypothetical protein PALB_22660 [Pseudoalteromonas luteoviolacea B = ATCC 29581]